MAADRRHAFLAAAATTPFGTFVAIPVTQSVDDSVLSLMFAVSAGLLLFVSTGPLMAHMRDDRPIRTLPALALGVIIALILVASHVPHGEHDAHDHGPPPFENPFREFLD